jgi:hypothetical protein
MYEELVTGLVASTDRSTAGSHRDKAWWLANVETQQMIVIIVMRCYHESRCRKPCLEKAHQAAKVNMELYSQGQ